MKQIKIKDNSNFFAADIGKVVTIALQDAESARTEGAPCYLTRPLVRPLARRDGFLVGHVKTTIHSPECLEIELTGYYDGPIEID